MNRSSILVLLFFLGILLSCSSPATYNILIKNGHVLDGSGSKGFAGDVSINADTNAAMGDHTNARGNLEIDTTGMIHVLVISVPVLSYGEHTDPFPSRLIKGPGWKVE